MKAQQFSARLGRPAALAVVVGVVAAFAASGPATSTAGSQARGGSFRIVLGSDRDGHVRAYSVRPDGSRLTLLSRNRNLAPVALSRNGRAVAYEDGQGGIYVSRADGSDLHRVVRANANKPALSPEGSMLAVRMGNRIWVVGANGRGLRRLTSGSNDDEPDWSPDGSTLAYSGIVRVGESGIFVQPLHGPRRLLVGGSVFRPKWSPNGRLVAYQKYRSSGARNGLYVIGRDGRHAHRFAPGVSVFAWSPDGRRLVFSDAGNESPPSLGLVRADGRGLRRLRLGILPSIPGWTPSLGWSPDGRRIVLTGHSGDDTDQIWTVASNGRGLRRVTNGGTNTFVGWTRLVPKSRPVPPLPPSERVLRADTLATHAPVTALSADGARVAFISGSTTTDCFHIAVWAPAAKALRRFSPSVPGPCREGGVGGMYGVELADSRLAWTEILGCGNSCDVSLESATLTQPLPVAVCSLCGSFTTGELARYDFHLRGDGDLLVFNDGSRAIRIGGGSERCQQDPRSPPICVTLRRESGPIDSVSRGLVAVREPDEVVVLDTQGSIVRVFPFVPDEVRAARLDEGHLVVERLAVLDEYSVGTGVLELSRPVPTGYRLEDVDGGIAVLRRGETLMLLRLADGSSKMIAPGRGPRFAELEPSGVYYSYAAGREGRVVFVPRNELF